MARSRSRTYLSRMNATTLAPGVTLVPGYLDRAAQGALLAAIRAVIAAAPLFVPRMPRTATTVASPLMEATVSRCRAR